MPGRIMTDNDLHAPKVKVDKASKDFQDHQSTLTSPSNGVKPPGSPTSRSDSSRMAALTAPNGSCTSNSEHGVQNLPPELEHMTLGYIPLQNVISRTAQECYNDLTSLIDSLGQQSRAQITNGVSHESETKRLSAASEQARLQWLAFASTHRDKLIKLSVILQWSRRVDDVGKLIDVLAWVNRQQHYVEDAMYLLGELKRTTTLNARMPRPDIDTALEILTRGGSNRFPDFGYAPPPPLPPDKLSETVRDMNVLLHTRLNLHEDVPKEFKAYHVHFGRVTFKVPNEFEIDLLATDGDPRSQFYIVDFRSPFIPCFEIAHGQFMHQIHSISNHALKTKGLAGCHEVLHEFILSHKINWLKRQALDLSKGRYSKQLRVESLRRTLTIQYWCDRPGKKSWIEIGVERSFASHTKQAESISSQLCLRWLKEGEEMIDQVSGSMLYETLDLEKILETVIAMHVSHILGSAYDSLLASDTTSATYSPFGITESEDDPQKCVLEVPLNQSRYGSVRVEPVTGNFALDPATECSIRHENSLNVLDTPAQDAFQVIRRWQAAEICIDIETAAHDNGFSSLKTSEGLHNTVKRNVDHGALETIFLSRQAWSTAKLCLIISVHPSRINWWIAKIGSGSLGGREKLLKIQHVPVSHRHHDGMARNRELFTNVERMAISTISCSLITRTLDQRRVQYSCSTRVSSSAGSVAVLAVDVDGLVGIEDPTLSGGTNRPLFHSQDTKIMPYKCTPCGNTDLYQEYFITGRLRRSNIRDELVAAVQPHEGFIRPSGFYCLRLRSLLSSGGAIHKIATRCKLLQRLNDFLWVLDPLGLQPTALSLASFSLTYATTPTPLEATLSFSQADKVSFTLQPKESNPHLRIQEHLDVILNRDDQTPAICSFHFLHALRITRPLLEALTSLEKDPPVTRPVIHVRNADHYLIGYHRPYCCFSVQFKADQEGEMWTVILLEQDPNSNMKRSTSLPQALNELFDKRGDGWKGIKVGLAAEPTHAGKMIERLHEIVVACDEGPTHPPSSGHDALPPAEQAPQHYSPASQRSTNADKSAKPLDPAPVPGPGSAAESEKQQRPHSIQPAGAKGNQQAQHAQHQQPPGQSNQSGNGRDQETEVVVLD